VSKYTSYESELHKRLVRKVNDVIESNAEALATGSCRVVGDVAATSMGYSHALGYREALTHAIAWLEEIESDLMSE